jgi:hypothetical protein
MPTCRLPASHCDFDPSLSAAHPHFPPFIIIISSQSARLSFRHSLSVAGVLE